MPRCSDCGSDLAAVGDPWDGDMRCPHCDAPIRTVQRKGSIGKIVLDSYEEVLVQSEEPADLAAVLIRQAIKKMGFDPDKDEWHVVREKWSVPEGAGVEVTLDNTYYRPVVVRNESHPVWVDPRPPWRHSEAASGLVPRCVCEVDDSSYKAIRPCGDAYLHSMMADGEHSVDWCGKCGHTRICCLTWCAERMEEYAPSAYADLRKHAHHHRIRKPIRRT